jgi:hypothetical protein
MSETTPHTYDARPWKHFRNENDDYFPDVSAFDRWFSTWSDQQGNIPMIEKFVDAMDTIGNTGLYLLAADVANEAAQAATVDLLAAAESRLDRYNQMTPSILRQAAEYFASNDDDGMAEALYALDDRLADAAAKAKGASK